MSEDRSALIIAICAYTDPVLGQLSAPAEDAAALAALLADPALGGFAVKTLFDETADVIAATIEEFLSDRHPDDLILLYFSGHGIKDEEGNLYFAGKNTKLVHNQLRRTTAVNSSFVNDAMRRCRSRRQVLLLDCCYSGAFPRDLVGKGGNTVDSESRFEGKGRIVLTASDAMQLAFEDRGETASGQARSRFTSTLVNALKTGDADRDQDGLVSVDELYQYVYEELRRTPPFQHPLKIGVTEGNLFLTRNPAPKPAKLPAELVDASTSQWVPTRLSAVKELARLVTGSNRALAEAARTALRALLEDDSRQIAKAAALALEPAMPSESRNASSPPPPQEAKAEPVEAATLTLPPQDLPRRSADQPPLPTIEAQSSTPSRSRAFVEAAGNAAGHTPQGEIRRVTPEVSAVPVVSSSHRGAPTSPSELGRQADPAVAAEQLGDESSKPAVQGTQEPGFTQYLLQQGRLASKPPSRIRTWPWKFGAVLFVASLVLVGVLSQYHNNKKEESEDTAVEKTAAPGPVTSGDSLTTAAAESVTTGDAPTTTASPSPLAEGRSWPVLFADDFSSLASVSRGWRPMKNSNGESTSVPAPGHLVLASSPDAQSRNLAEAREVSGDFYVTVDMKGLKTSEFSEGGIEFRLTEDTAAVANCYAVQLHGAFYERWLQEKKSWRLLLRSSAPGLRPLNQVNTLAVVVKGAQVFVFLNGEEADRFESIFDSGWVGLAVGRGEFDFANFELRTPRPSSPPG